MSRRSTRSMAMSDSLQSTSSHISSVLPSSNSVQMGSYMQTQYNHPAFNKLYLGPNYSGKSHMGAVPKPPKPPEKPLMAYMRYSRKIWDDVKSSNSELKLWEVGKIIGQMWRELPQSEKQQFIDDYEAEKSVYNEALKSYHNSPQYQAYLQAKARAEALEAVSENLPADKDEAYMSIEPADDGGGGDDGFSVKHIAAARFQRNHRLINDIIGEGTHVPNLRVIVTNQRLNVLKNQVKSLEVHQLKLETELDDIEAGHIAKKRKWKESCSEFAQEMKRLRELTPQEFYQEWKRKQSQAQALQKEQAAKKAAEAKAEEAKKETEKMETDEKEKKSEIPEEKKESKTEKKEEAEEKMETDETRIAISPDGVKEEDKRENKEEDNKETNEKEEVKKEEPNDEVTEKKEENVKDKDKKESEKEEDKSESEKKEETKELKSVASEEKEQESSSKEENSGEDKPDKKQKKDVEEMKVPKAKKKVERTTSERSRARTRSRSTSDEGAKNDRKRRRKSDK